MIRLIFTYNREIMHFVIKDKYVYYTDRKWVKFLQCLPQDKEFILKMKMSRNMFPAFLIKMFELSDEELKEYEDAKSEEELALIIERDGKSRGCRLLSKNKIAEEI